MIYDKVGLFVAGLKGHALSSGLVEKYKLQFICSYRQNSSSCHFEEIKALALKHGVEFFERKDFPTNALERSDLALVAGWQFKINDFQEKLVVFHDSLLPKFRGFSPTVAALIAGEDEIGVTAIRPNDVIDDGAIVAQEILPIKYPITIAEAYSGLNKLYITLAEQVLTKKLTPKPQDRCLASYSIWRDKEDYQIDWKKSANEISRFVDAVGQPYDGARTTYSGNEIIVIRTRIIPNLDFVDRMPGKLWSIDDNRPAVICGSGMIQILEARTKDGSNVVFDKLRQRLK